MLADISETKAIMQVDEVERVMCRKVEITNDMTVKSDNDSRHSKIKEEPQIDEVSSEVDNITRYRGINLEDDIEKVEVTSHESSEEIEEFKNAPSPKKADQNIFSRIPTQSPNESIKSWLHRITEVQNEMQKKYLTGLENNSNQLPLNSLKSNSSNQLNTSTSANPNSSRVVKYQDLPFMGEMTLDNSKPRRGRKPKKADICHLIYKNYGTIFPGTPNPGNYLEKDNSIFKKSVLLDNKDDSLNRSDVQNRIISSLLEKRLTQEYNRNKDSKGSSKEAKSKEAEPLNLCIRDLNHLKIKLHKKNDNTYTSEIKSEPQSDDDIELIQESTSPNNPLSMFPIMPPGVVPGLDPLNTTEGTTGPGGYVYWSNAGVFIHPAALQQQLMMYQRIASGNSYTLPNSPSPKPFVDVNSLNLKDHGSSELRKLVPKVVKPKPSSPKNSRDETDFHPPQTKDVKRRNASTSENYKSPTKRKRSAIFIPPIPPENNSTPSTEVSICKFKFTGGAKPSLQEKKMLSVDSGGNFRYYSGTGDKSMRGYEFFPRETLQQQINNAHGSSTGAFLQASGEKIYPTPPADFTGAKTSSEFLLSPEIPATTFPAAHSSSQDHSQRQKKRKSRKSLQREKLEQTFKEKGFLIQTQQTESAEGATYCKFRQLRKFTRYLFRSWKDYLPGNIAEEQQQQQQQQQPKSSTNETNDNSIDNHDDVSVHSSELSVNNV